MEAQLLIITSSVVIFIALSFALKCAKAIHEKDMVISRLIAENKNLHNRIDYYEELITMLKKG